MDLEIFVGNLVVFQLKYVGVESQRFAFEVYVPKQCFPVGGDIPITENLTNFIKNFI